MRVRSLLFPSHPPLKGRHQLLLPIYPAPSVAISESEGKNPEQMKRQAGRSGMKSGHPFLVRVSPLLLGCSESASEHVPCALPLTPGELPSLAYKASSFPVGQQRSLRVGRTFISQRPSKGIDGECLFPSPLTASLKDLAPPSHPGQQCLACPAPETSPTRNVGGRPLLGRN